ncbi:unnamed protein product [Porites evermanni]|uniref:E3 ubiquitin-protein ligase E3D n=1 Tax=Porites evermanni TaxID=104178 RepID=A0ABN8QNL9_9CNID|nr:unnamed protein product [Porites evermanni]
MVGSNKGANMYFIVAAFSLTPRSCTGLTVCRGSEIQMRLQFQYCPSEHQEEVLKRLGLGKELQELRNRFHSICCRMCGSFVLSPDRKFKRVLELPSENWLELAQDWCCHGSSHLTSATGVLEPSEDDCFVGAYYIKVHPATAVANNLRICSGEDEDEIKCCRCNSSIGIVIREDSNLHSLDLKDVSSLYLHKHRISLRHSDLFRSYRTETFISSCLISKSKGAVNFRFLVQESLRSGEKITHACLWLFNADTAVVTNIEPCADFHCEKRPSEGGAYSITNKAKYMRVVKILYKARTLADKSSWKDEVAAWEENPSVEVLTFAKEICFHLILLLSQSTNTIAPSLREMNGFKVRKRKCI